MANQELDPFPVLFYILIPFLIIISALVTIYIFKLCSLLKINVF